jgi:hypothetical protein
MSQKQPPTSILPTGYYKRDPGNPYLVRLLMGPYQGLVIQIMENIKIRTDYLTGTPQLCYDYRVLHYGSYESRECESSVSLSRIIAAIAVEFLAEEILGGAGIESCPCPNPALKK